MKQTDSPARKERRGSFSFSRQFRPSLIQCSKKKVTRIKKNSSQDFLLRESGKQNTYHLSCQNLVFLTFFGQINQYSVLQNQNKIKKAIRHFICGTVLGLF